MIFIYLILICLLLLTNHISSPSHLIGGGKGDLDTSAKIFLTSWEVGTLLNKYRKNERRDWLNTFYFAVINYSMFKGIANTESCFPYTKDIKIEDIIHILDTTHYEVDVPNLSEKIKLTMDKVCDMDKIDVEVKSALDVYQININSYKVYIPTTTIDSLKELLDPVEVTDIVALLLRYGADSHRQTIDISASLLSVPPRLYLLLNDIFENKGY